MNILEKIDQRIEVVKNESVRQGLIDLGNCAKELHKELYDETGAYRDLSIGQLESIRERAASLVEDWKGFYSANKDNPSVVLNGRFTDECMVCNDYIMHANDFDVPEEK